MLLSLLKRLKRSLQFTGWLQYIAGAVVALFFLVIAAIPLALGYPPAAYPFLCVGGLLLILLVFDIFTVKFHLHPEESIPARNDQMETFDLIRGRRSCRSFQSRKLTTSHLSELMESVRIHSTSPRIGPPIRLEYISAPLTVWPVVGAHEFLVAIVPSEYDRLAVIEVGRTLQHVVIHATRMGLATCWIGPGADQSSIERHLGENFNAEKDHIICVCAIGYKSRYIPFFIRYLVSFIQHRRLPLASLFYADSEFKEPLDAERAPFNRFGRCYEICQWSPSSFNAQPTRCVGAIDNDENQMEVSDQGQPKGVRFDFYASTNSRYYAAVALGIWCANWEMGCEALGIQGHFAVLSPTEGGRHNGKDGSPIPRYDVSWVPEAE